MPESLLERVVAFADAIDSDLIHVIDDDYLEYDPDDTLHCAHDIGYDLPDDWMTLEDWRGE
jgi:hypothetical protein